jgi:hypothetical protein
MGRKKWEGVVRSVCVLRIPLFTVYSCYIYSVLMLRLVYVKLKGQLINFKDVENYNIENLKEMVNFRMITSG